MRRAAVAGLVLVVLVGGFLLLESSSRVHRATPAEGATEPVEAAPAEPAPEEAEDGEEEVPAVEVRGTVVVEDEHGRHLNGESGTLRTEHWGNFEVSRGEWRARLPVGWFTFDEAVLGDRRAVPDPRTVEIPEDGVVEVRCRWFLPARLRVIGEKGEDLPGVQLVDRDDDTIVPVDEFTVLEAGDSPVTLPAEDAGLAKYWVRAKDHAWSRIAVWQGDGGERVVRLVRAGTLEARLVPFDAEGEVALHVYRAGTFDFGWSPDESGLARIEGLPPGRLGIRAAIGLWWEERTFASAEVEIERGRTTEVTLAVRAIPPSAPVRVEGTLHVADGWPEPESGGFCGLGNAEAITVDGGYGGPVELDFDNGRWSASLPPGPHSFTVEPWQWTQLVEVGPEGTTEARLVVPSPCDVEVRLVDGETGEAIADDDHLHWHVRSGKVDTWLVDWAYLGCAEPGVWRFEAPVGTLGLSLWNDLRGAEAEFELKPGKNRIDLKAVPNFACDVALKDGAIPVPVAEDSTDAIRATPLDGDGELDSCGDGFPCRVWVEKKGRYRITLPEIDGYEPIAPFEVEFAAGTIPRIEIPLKRR